MIRWSRRTFGRRVLEGAAGLAATGMGCRRSGERGDEPAPRGIVLITADDLGWKDVGAYGLASVATPAIDRLVHEGVAFGRAFDVVSTCSSSRATFVTGQYPHTHGVTGLTHRHPELSLPPDTPTLVRTLWDQGVVTAIQGKWHITAVDAPEAFAYDVHLPTGIDQWIRGMDDALAFLESVGEAPFYLELNYMQTHRDVLGRFLQAEGFEVSPDQAPVPDWWGLPDWPEIRAEVAGYLSHLRWMDALVGDLLAGLDALGLADDTLVCFVSDNGPAFPGCKTTVHDRGLGTPLVFRWPRGLAPGWSEELVATVQLAPTILELAGAPPLPRAQGRSLAPLLRGRPWEPATAVFGEMEHHVGPVPARAVRTATHRYIWNVTAKPWGAGEGDASYTEALALEPDQSFADPRPQEQLFAIDGDPLERVDLADNPDSATVLAWHRGLLRRHMEATEDFRAPEFPH